MMWCLLALGENALMLLAVELARMLIWRETSLSVKVTSRNNGWCLANESSNWKEVSNFEKWQLANQ